MHVEQVSVHPDHAGHRIGSDLIDVVVAWGRQRGMTALALTTFADVAWNAPYYRRLGFAVVAEEDYGAQLRRIREVEQAGGLDRWPRIAMRRTIDDPAR